MPRKVTAPKRLKVGHLDYRIEWIDDDPDNYGVTHSVDQVVLLDKSMTPARMAEIFDHELTHVLISSFGVPVPDDLEESTVKSLSACRTAFWRDNLDALDWWVGLIKEAARKKNG